MTASFSHCVHPKHCKTVVNLRLSMRYCSFSTMAAPTATSTASFKVTDHVDVLGKEGNNSTFQCKHCTKTFSGTATRVLIHLTGIGTGVAACTEIDPEVKAAVKAYKLSNDAANAAKKRKRDEQEELLRERRASSSTAGTSSSNHPAAPARGSVSTQAISCLQL
jgi:hypothetical protein